MEMSRRNRSEGIGVRLPGGRGDSLPWYLIVCTLSARYQVQCVVGCKELH
jgi:hypothetical protein